MWSRRSPTLSIASRPSSPLLQPIDALLVQWLKHDPCTSPLPVSDSSQWAELLDAAARHALLPILYQAAKMHPDMMPSDMMQELQERTNGIAAKNLWLASELRLILTAMQEQQIRCIPLRGVALAEQLHGHLAMRPTGDLDVLIRQDDLPQIRDLFRAMGYIEAEPRRGFAEAFYYTLELFKEGLQPLTVEPHWSLAYPPFHRMPMEPVWGRCRPGTVLGIPSEQLAPEDLLIHLCLHNLHHGHTSPLLWSYELTKMLHTQSLDWTLVVTAARASRVHLLIHASLRELRERFAVLIPDSIMQELAAQSDAAQHRLAVWLTPPSSTKGKGHEYVATLISLPGLRAKGRFLIGYLFPSTTFIRIQYGTTGGWSTGCRYLKRLGMIVWEGCRGLIRLLWRSKR